MSPELKNVHLKNFVPISLNKKGGLKSPPQTVDKVPSARMCTKVFLSNSLIIHTYCILITLANKKDISINILTYEELPPS